MEINSHSSIRSSSIEPSVSQTGLNGQPLDAQTAQTAPVQTPQAGVSVDISAAGRLAAASQVNSQASGDISEEQVQLTLQALREASAAAPGQFASSQANIASQQVRSLLG